VTVDDASDPILRRISRLPVLSPDDRRAAQLRARCRARMRRTPTPEPILGRVLFAGLCVLYLSALVLDVMRLPGVL
jgi:hypothetical protein